jgi:energy-coupling factor transporter ATP-binding protein EcfA2/ABC-type multidrug transport system permease subunit
MLQMPSLTLTDDERRARVFETIKLLSLEQCASTTISKLSGGERKRLAFATVALIDPSILLIDEPTSNLDSHLAKSLMQIIRTLAVERHRSVVIVLHQPTSEMFKFIDSLCVLIHGGRQAFFGDAHRDASPFFTDDCGLVASSLDGFIEQLAAPETSASKEAMQSVERFATSSYASSLAASTTPSTTDSFIGSSLTSSLTLVPSFYRQMKWLLWRSFKAGARNPVHTHNVFIKTLVPAIILGLLYFNLPHRLPLQNYTNNVNGLLYLVIYVTATTCGSLVSGTMPKEILVFLKETQHSMYGTLAFYLSTYLHAFPTLIFVPVIFCSILYWCASIWVHHHKFIHFLVFVSTVVLTSSTCAALGELIASTSSSVETAVGTTVPVLQILVIFSGYFVDLRRLPLALKIFQYLSPFYYGYSILTELQWDTGSNSASTIRFDFAMLFLLFTSFNILAFAVIWYRAHRLRLAEKWHIITKDKS